MISYLYRLNFHLYSHVNHFNNYYYFIYTSYDYIFNCFYCYVNYFVKLKNYYYCNILHSLYLNTNFHYLHFTWFHNLFVYHLIHNLVPYYYILCLVLLLFNFHQNNFQKLYLNLLHFSVF